MAINEITTPTEIATFDDRTGGNPLDIQVAIEPVQNLNGYSSPWVGGNGKNKLKFVANTTTISGVTYTNNGDGTVTASGTATANAVLYLNTAFEITDSQEYIFSGCTGGSSTTYEMQAYYRNSGNASLGTVVNYSGDSRFKLADKSGCVRINTFIIVVRSGATVNNVVFKPMVRLASVSDSTFEPYENICPIEGFTSAKITQTGKNLLPNGLYNYDKIYTTNGLTFTRNSDNSITAVGTATANVFYTLCDGYTFKPGSYRLSGGVLPNNAIISLRRNHTGGAQIVASGGVESATFTFTENTNVGAIIRIASGTTVDGTFYPMVRLADSEPGYEPYFATTYSIDFESAGTVYGGTLDISTGLLTVTTKMITESDFALAGSTSGGNLHWFNAPISYPAASGASNDICSMLPYIQNPNTAWASKTPVLSTNTGGYPARIYDTSTTNDEFRAKFSGLKVVYHLATPVTYQLTRHQISAILNQNNIWSDTGKINSLKGGYTFHDKLTSPVTQNDAIDKINELVDDYKDVANAGMLSYVDKEKLDTLESTYLPVSGGTMTGPVKWLNSAALPQTTNPQYLLAIDAFNQGGTQKWAEAADVRTAIGAVAKAGDTMTGQLITSFGSSVAFGSRSSLTTNIPDLCEELRYSSGCIGSFLLATAYTKDGITIPASVWYNYMWIPHRTGGLNGAANGDNCNFGTLYLTGMNGAYGRLWIINYSSSTIRRLQEYAPLNGGVLSLATSLYEDNYTSGALNLNNSNIQGVNSIYTSDTSDSAQEGIHFYRSSTTVDSVHASNGNLYFTPNRTLGTAGTSYAVMHDGRTMSANLLWGGYLNIHPENNPVIIPFMHNDIAFLTARGGSCVIKYDGTTQSVDSTALFDGTPSYWYMNPTGITTITMELTMHRTFTYGNIIYVDFGAAGWRAKYVNFEYMSSGATEWTQLYNVENNSSGHVNFYYGFSSTGFNKLRITFKDCASATIFRVAQIGVYNYGSFGLREPFMSRGVDDPVYRSITPGANGTYDLGSSTYKWRNIYGNVTGNATTASYAQKLETYKQNSTTETYGTSYPLFARWRTNVDLSLICSGYSTEVNGLYPITLRPSSANPSVVGGGQLRHFYASSAMTTAKPPFGDGAIIHVPWDGNNGFDMQLAMQNTSGRIAVRGMQSGTWQAWNMVYDEGHKPTKSDVGLGNVDNTADANKSVSKAATLTTARTIDGVSFNGSANISHYGSCAISGRNGTVACTGFTLAAGAWIAVFFPTSNNTTSSEALLLNVNSTGGKEVKYYRSVDESLPANAYVFASNRTYLLVYDGTNYRLIGDLDTTVTYDEGTAQQLSAGSVLQAELWSPKILHDYIAGASVSYATSAGTATSATNATNATNVTGVIGADHGGTGKTTLNDSANVLINSLATGSSTPGDNDYYVSQYVGGGTTTTTYHRRPMSALWEYVKGKISSVLGLTVTSYGGNAATATSATTATKANGLSTARAIDGVLFQGLSDITHYGYCQTAAGTASKAVQIVGFDIANIPTGSRISVKFQYTNTAAVGSLTLTINNGSSNSTAKYIKYRGANLPTTDSLKANGVYEFVYDGTYWQLVGDLDSESNVSTTWDRATITNSTVTFSSGGHYVSGRHCYVQMQLTTAKAISANTVTNILSGMPAPTGSLAVLQITIGNKMENYMAQVTTGGVLRIRSASSISSGATVNITGVYTIS